ncbi:hypothetical protein [Sphaerisporangium sp. NPDC051011]|uniref:hypothetical protein n=1 Tax=Sphaerisporangium sp. NPDC051011 TaxID=3155792 RepID=UPI0033D2BFB4
MPPEQQPSARPTPNIAVWGAPGSGKTTFLAALNIALILKKGPWKVVGADGPSRDFLIEMTSALSEQQRFPDATLALGQYKWFLTRQIEKRRWPLGRKSVQSERIGLDVLDAPGGFYSAKRASAPTSREELLNNLQGSRGIVYLFDPIREHKVGDAFSYLHGVLTELAGRMLTGNRYAGDVLPHHLAVCVTKFDELKVLQTAEKLGLLAPDPDDPFGFPRIDDDYAEELFEQLCGISRYGNAKMVVPALKQHFRHDRIKFFVTSSIGFYLDNEKGAFDPDDPQNLVPTAWSAAGEAGTATSPGSGFQIRGPVHPINVMEPMVWLGRRISAERPAGETRG